MICVHELFSPKVIRVDGKEAVLLLRGLLQNKGSMQKKNEYIFAPKAHFVQPTRQGHNTCTVNEARGIQKKCFIPDWMTGMWWGISVFYPHFIPNGISLPDHKTSIFKTLIRINIQLFNYSIIRT